jgi:hypothetical protein
MAPNTNDQPVIAEISPEVLQPEPPVELEAEELVRLGRYVGKRDRITRAAAVDRIRRLPPEELEQLRGEEAAGAAELRRRPEDTDSVNS